jgi:hypothetical protein
MFFWLSTVTLYMELYCDGIMCSPQSFSSFLGPKLLGSF